MKTTLISITAFVIGIVVGIFGIHFSILKSQTQVIADLAQGYTSEGAIYGTLLFDKRYDDVQRLIENGFFTSLNYQKGLGLPKENYVASQKFVRGYFDATNRPVPASIEEHIQDIPKGAGTDMRRFSDSIAQTMKEG